MKKLCWTMGVLGVVLAIGVGSGLAARSGRDGGDGVGDLEMYVSPGMIVLSAPCNWVTIHTDVPYCRDDVVEAKVNDQDVPSWSYFDDRGFLVVKIRFDVVADLALPPSVDISLTVVKVDGKELTAVATVRVKE